MGWLATVIGIFLFYRFVERRHKILSLKILGILVLIAALVGGGIAGYNELQERRLRTGVEVTFSSITPKLPDRVKERLIDVAYRKLMADNGYLFEGLTPDGLSFAKELFFQGHLTWGAITKDAIGNIDNEFETLLETWGSEPAKVEAAKAKLAQLEKSRIGRYATDRMPASIVAKAGNAKYLIAMVALRRIDSLDTELAKEEFKKSLAQDLINETSLLARAQKDAKKLLGEEFNGSRDLTSAISFKICNKRDVSLNTVSFYASGFTEGRSTANAIKKDDSSYSHDTRFESDIIVKPRECSSITWTADYKFFDSYEVKYPSATWAE